MAKGKNHALVHTVTAGLFGVIALLHAYRLINKVPVLFGDLSIPLWLSGVAAVASAALAAWLWRTQK